MKQGTATYLVLATIVVDAIGVGIIFPIMPELMAHVGADSTAVGAGLGGVLLASYALMQFLFAPVVGGLSDKFGRRPLLLLSLLVLAIDYVIMALANSYFWLLFGRVMAGIAGSTHITGTAYLADISSKEERASKFGLVGAAFGIGFVLGPIIGGVAATFHLSAPFWLAASFALANFLIAWRFLPESLPAEHRRRLSRQNLNPFSSLLGLFKFRELRFFLLIIFGFEFANMVYPTLWSYWTHEVFGWNAAKIGVTLTFYGVGVAVAQGVVLKYMIRWFGERLTLFFSFSCGIVSLTIFGVVPTVSLLFILILISSLSDMVPPLMSATMSRLVRQDQQGELQGAIASLGSLAAVVAPICMTTLFFVFTEEGTMYYFPGMPFLLSGLMLAVLLFVVVRGLRADGPNGSDFG